MFSQIHAAAPVAKQKSRQRAGVPEPRWGRLGTAFGMPTGTTAPRPAAHGSLPWAPTAPAVGSRWDAKGTFLDFPLCQKSTTRLRPYVDLDELYTCRWALGTKSRSYKSFISHIFITDLIFFVCGWLVTGKGPHSNWRETRYVL